MHVCVRRRLQSNPFCFIFVRLGGILAGYGKLTITKPNAETFFNLSDIHVEVEGDFFIFTPEIGQELVGKFFLYCTINYKCTFLHSINIFQVPSTGRLHLTLVALFIICSMSVCHGLTMFKIQIGLQNQLSYNKM